ncbi:response regulator [Paenibacillus sp. 1011MAR3C5]|uniref:response regulator n=1 Tax=Paenibacillus sp. 1011MAR3C5 TaxID=1675787 RepID=UPI000E6B51EC|nr:response regulator [Paenibacillus sp. 1011MAR3C5]RJE87479.1 response regulator [Paenibacillus sp. 1011MAR3C5]
MRVILIDDERLALDYMAYQLADLPKLEIIGKHTDPHKGKEHIIQSDVDIVFLDIHLPEISGLELAEQLLEKKPYLSIVFVTAYNDYAVRAFELDALDYIVKPVLKERLLKTINRLKERRESAGDERRQESCIRMKLFRQAEIGSGSHPYELMHWRTAKAQELFLYLLLHRKELVRKSTLIDLLWPEAEDSEKVYAQLYTTVYHVRKGLSGLGRHFELMNATDGYRLDVVDVGFDVEEWESAVSLDQPLKAETIDRYTAAMELYSGDFLQEYDYWWAEAERERLRQLWLRASLRIAEWYESNGQSDQAILRYLEIGLRQPVAEEAHFGLMKLFAAQRNHAAVHRQYRVLEHTLQAQLNEQPSPYIAEWYNKWLEQNRE